VNLRRAATAALGLLLSAGAVVALAQTPTSPSASIAQGRTLYEEGCASCHGMDARGVAGQGPSLRGAGAAAADFYLRTGRMPLDDPGDQPERSDPRYPDSEIDALVAYVGSLGGPRIPDVNPEQGSLREGLEAFTESCAGCHQVVARGGIVTGGFAPDLEEASPEQVAEAVRLGPYLMPRFDRRTMDDHTLDSIARYVEQTKDPEDPGGWAIGNIGPVPEGMVAWLLAIAALLLLARLIGERTRS